MSVFLNPNISLPLIDRLYSLGMIPQSALPVPCVQPQENSCLTVQDIEPAMIQDQDQGIVFINPPTKNVCVINISRVEAKALKEQKDMQAKYQASLGP